MREKRRKSSFLTNPEQPTELIPHEIDSIKVVHYKLELIGREWNIVNDTFFTLER